MGFEELAGNTYARFAKTAQAYHYGFSRAAVSDGGVPCMLFLGNHSSGKSSLVNWLAGDAVQDVGLAPTDDGFTFLMYGDREEDVCGPAAVARLPREFSGLDRFGGNLLERLRVKIRNLPLLKKVTLVDSPGMIDAAEKTVSRSYDFEGTVRFLSGLCDMVFFTLDPDKPGTTGETVDMLSKCLGGMESKLMVLFNKCDTVDSLYDFARVYGNVCWNLARVLHTKDLPKIWTIYSGEERESGRGGMSFADFNRHRNEFRSIVENDAAARRRDNIFSQTRRDFLGLSIRMRILGRLSRTLAAISARTFLAAAAVVAGIYFFAKRYFEVEGWIGFVVASAFSIVAVAIAVAVSFFLRWFFQKRACARFSRDIDLEFGKEFGSGVATGARDDFKQAWAQIRAETAEIALDRKLVSKLPFFSGFCRKRLDAAAEKVGEAFRKENQGQ